MLVEFDYSILKDEVEYLKVNKPEEYLSRMVKSGMAGELSKKLTEYIPFEPVERFNTIEYQGKIVILGGEDFFRIRGMLNRIWENPSTPDFIHDIAKDIDQIMYAEFNNLPADQVLPRTEF